VAARTSTGFFMSQVPRVKDITGKASQEDLAAQREYERTRKLFDNDRSKYGFGSDKSKEAWKRRIDKTRSV
jgi:hypothetical protein